MRTPGGRDVVQQARELVESLHLDAVAREEGAQSRQRVRVHRAGGRPGDVRQMAEDAIEVDLVRTHEQMRERVQAQVRVGRRRRRAVEVDLDRHHVHGDGATRVGHREMVERVRRQLRIEPERDASGSGGGEPRVEHGSVFGGRREADAPHPSFFGHGGQR